MINSFIQINPVRKYVLFNKLLKNIFFIIIGDSAVVTFAFSVLKDGQQPFNFQLHVSKEFGDCEYSPSRIKEAFGDLKNKVMKICGLKLLPDGNMKPCQIIDQTGGRNYFLTIYGKNKFELGSSYRTTNNPLIIEIFDRGKLKRFNN